MQHAFLKKLVFLKFKSNWIFCIFICTTWQLSVLKRPGWLMGSPSQLEPSVYFLSY